MFLQVQVSRNPPQKPPQNLPRESQKRPKDPQRPQEAPKRPPKSYLGASRTPPGAIVHQTAKKKTLKERKLIPIGPKNQDPDRFPPDNPPKGGFAKNGKRQKALSVIEVWIQRCPLGCPGGPWDPQNGTPGYQNRAPRPPK